MSKDNPVITHEVRMVTMRNGQDEHYDIRISVPEKYFKKTMADLEEIEQNGIESLYRD